MLCRGRGDLAGDTAETFHDQLLQGPTCAVTGQHGQVMNVDVGLLVSLMDLRIVDLGKPVVRSNGTGVVKNQTADGIRNGGVLLNTPVLLMDITVHDFLIVKNRGLHLTQLFALLAVQNVCLRNVGIARLLQNVLHAVLNVLNADYAVVDFILKLRRNAQRKKADDVGSIFLVRRLKRFLNGCVNLVQIKFFQFPVSFRYLNHTCYTLLFSVSSVFSLFIYASRAIDYIIAQQQVRVN